ncbi:hypothetical protein [Actinomycetospora termitidis]|uniref:Uncharacterized protein n=1 Tax=Actinomycetospora termitidis TaxID=3053470 RepID=A0ABT7MGR9_9PSEU|nr:hypothetical protein [Actinomycetospora sp. Odt1-22]MDL5159878.1 hypothetical protein [Actinomycetospora sp. Odt1-22]
MSVTPRPTRRPSPPSPSEDGALGPLRRTLGTALGMLGDLRTLHPAVTSGHLERRLRAEIERVQRGPDGGCSAIPAVSTACSHLATRSYEDAYLALVTAVGLLPRRPS